MNSAGLENIVLCIFDDKRIIVNNYILENVKYELNIQLFAKDGDGGEKTEPATSKKLDDIRKEGQVAKSKDLIMAVMLLALFYILDYYVGTMGTSLMTNFKNVYSTFSLVVESSNSGYPDNLALGVIGEMFVSIITIGLPFFIIAIIIAILGNALQQRWMVTAKPLTPKFSKLNPISGVKRLFSVRQLLELLKSVAMIVVICVVIFSTVQEILDLLLTFYNISLNAALAAIGEIIIDTGIKISGVFLVIGFVDLIYQRHKFKEDNKMTKQEVKDEYKNSEGDPQVKGQIKRKMMEISTRRMMQQLPEADVVITNPTHFAVALKYEPNEGRVPVVIAKGADHLAFQIREKAKEYKIEIVENKPLARILYNNVDIGSEIPPELYQVVAEILARILQPA